MVYLGCQWLITLLVVRMSSSMDDAGYLNLAISITSAFGTAAAFNLRPYIISDSNNEISSREYSGFRVLTCTASFAACLIYSAFFGYSITQYSCIVIYMVFRIGEALLDLYYGFEQKNFRMDIGGKSMIARGVLSIAGFAGAFALTNSLIIAMVVMTAATYVVILFYDWPKAREFGNFKPEFTRSFKRLARDGSIITATSLIADWIIIIPRQFIESLMGVAAKGIYSTVAAPVSIMQVGILFIFNPLLPVFDQHYKACERAQYRALVVKTMVLIGLVAVAGLVLFMLFGEPLLALLYGDEVAGYAYLLPTLIAITCLSAILWLLRLLLVMCRALVAQLIATAVSFALCCAVCIPAIGAFGFMGANASIIFAYTLSCIASAVILALHLRKHFVSTSMH